MRSKLSKTKIFRKSLRHEVLLPYARLKLKMWLLPPERVDQAYTTVVLIVAGIQKTVHVIVLTVFKL